VKAGVVKVQWNYFGIRKFRNGSSSNVTIIFFIELLLFSFLLAFYEKYAVLLKFTFVNNCPYERMANNECVENMKIGQADILFPNFFSLLFNLYQNSHGTPVDPLCHITVLWHTVETHWSRHWESHKLPIKKST
jgi:hypothetical protein